MLTAIVLLAGIGEIERFPSAKHLVGHSGLGARMHASGQTFHTGGITKQGRRELRAAVVEAAWMAVEHSEHWRRTFERLATRAGRQKAIAAIARENLCDGFPFRFAGEVVSRLARLRGATAQIKVTLC